MDGVAITDPKYREQFRVMAPGPWTDEPDRVFGRHESGLYWLLKRGGAGAWCGYVAVTKDHPAFGIEYSALDVEVHGGLTFSGRWFELAQYWWFGFDCCHYGDLSPLIAPIWGGPSHDIYRTVEYAHAEVMDLARQLAKLQHIKYIPSATEVTTTSSEE